MSSNQKTVMETKYLSAIEKSASQFAESKLDFSHEKIFATQQLIKNQFAVSVANKEPSSLKLAMYNVAAVGLTLNPQLGLAYLVPRRLARNEPFKMVLDISYRGLIEIAVSSGAVLSVGAELVCEKDSFRYRGKFTYPDHDFDPFATDLDRGAVRGGYVVATLPSRERIVTTMSLADFEQIKALSPSADTAFSPWITFEEQMQLKSLVKRGFKWWPAQHQRMATAMSILNEENGEGLAHLSDDSAQVELPEPPLRTEIPVTVLHTVKAYIDRAVKVGAFEACKELMESRIKNLSHLAYALDELRKAKSACTIYGDYIPADIAS